MFFFLPRQGRSVNEIAHGDMGDYRRQTCLRTRFRNLITQSSEPCCKISLGLSMVELGEKIGVGNQESV